MWFKNWTNLFTNQDNSSVLDKMRNINPIYIPRNHLVEKAINLANEGDYSFFNELNKNLESPYKKNLDDDIYSMPPTEDELVEQTFCGT